MFVETLFISEERPSDRALPELTRELADARSEARAALARRELTGDAQLAAFRLGGLLRESADREELWAELEQPAALARPLAPKDLLAFKAALEVDWSSLLDDVGYQPPPPSLVWNRELVDAMTAVLDGEAEADIADARAQLHELGRTLVELSRLGPPDEGRLRRAMRKGVRVAASLLVLAGVVAAIQVAPAIAPFAGAVALAERVIGS
jgi:hypothetical protein